MGSMKDQLGDIPFQARARGSDPETSHLAARAVSSRLSDLQYQVLNAIRAAGDRGATWDEVADATGLDKGSVSPRFKPLRERGLITEKMVGLVKIKRTAPGKHCGQIVWVARDPA